MLHVRQVIRAVKSSINCQSCMCDWSNLVWKSNVSPTVHTFCFFFFNCYLKEYSFYCGYARPFLQEELAPVMFVLTEWFARGRAVKLLAFNLSYKSNLWGKICRFHFQTTALDESVAFCWNIMESICRKWTQQTVRGADIASCDNTS